MSQLETKANSCCKDYVVNRHATLDSSQHIERGKDLAVMYDHKADSLNMKNCSSRGHGSYDKEMDHAFTLIFHNIKRLRDDRLSNSAPSLYQADVQPEKMPPMALKVPFQRERFRSAPSFGLTVKEMEQHAERSDIHAKSRSFTGLDSSPLQRPKVRFADDYVAKDKLKTTRAQLSKRPWSDLHGLQPLIVVTKES